MLTKQSFDKMCQSNVRNVNLFLFLYIRSTIRPVSAVHKFFIILSKKSSELFKNPLNYDTIQKTTHIKL